MKNVRNRLKDLEQNQEHLHDEDTVSDKRIISHLPNEVVYSVSSTHPASGAGTLASIRALSVAKHNLRMEEDERGE